MAHEIENNMMMSVREIPWHRQGTVLAAPPSTAEAIRAAKLDWRVSKVPLHAAFEDNTGDYVVVTHVPTEFFATVRTPIEGEDAPVVLGAVSDRYTTIQNEDAFEVFDRVLLPAGYIYETAGAIKNGKRVWILAKAPTHDKIGGTDRVDRYITLMTAHDGSSSVRLIPTSVRVVCNNTLTIALTRAQGEGFSFIHTGNAGQKLDMAARALRLTEGEFPLAVAIWEQMFTTQVTPLEAIHYWERVMPDLKKRGDATGRNWKTAFELLSESFMYGRGNRGETLWHAYNAITEWLDHKKTTAANRAVDYLVLGGGAKIKSEALSVASGMIADRVFGPTMVGVN